MHLSQLLKELSYSEFSNLAVGEKGSGEIAEHRIPSVVTAINGALLRIYSKFLQHHKTAVIKKLEGKLEYVISSAYSESEGATDPYVMDAGNPFKDDILKIVGVSYQDPATNEFLDVDRRFRAKPITVNVPRTVYLPAEVPVGELLWVKYRASHPVVDFEEDTFIEAPPSAFEAIKAYVAYKEYSAMNTETGVTKGQEYLAAFNALCNELVDRDTIGVTEDNQDNRFQNRGFV